MLELLVADVNRVAAVIQAVLKDGPLITGKWCTDCIKSVWVLSTAFLLFIAASDSRKNGIAAGY